MRNLVILITTLLVLVACGGAEFNSSPTKTFSGIGTAAGVNETGDYNLIISGLNNTLTVYQNNSIRTLNISGSNNQLTINRNTSVGYFLISGNDNTVLVPHNSGITFISTGIGNVLIKY